MISLLTELWIFNPGFYKYASPDGPVTNEEGRMKNEETVPAPLRFHPVVSSFIILNSSFPVHACTAVLTDWLQTPTRASFAR